MFMFFFHGYYLDKAGYVDFWANLILKVIVSPQKDLLMGFISNYSYINFIDLFFWVLECFTSPDKDLHFIWPLLMYMSVSATIIWVSKPKSVQITDCITSESRETLRVYGVWLLAGPMEKLQKPLRLGPSCSLFGTEYSLKQYTETDSTAHLFLTSNHALDLDNQP